MQFPGTFLTDACSPSHHGVHCVGSAEESESDERVSLEEAAAAPDAADSFEGAPAEPAPEGSVIRERSKFPETWIFETADANR